MTESQHKDAERQLAAMQASQQSQSTSQSSGKKDNINVLKQKKDPNAPKKPPSSYMIYLRKRRMELEGDEILKNVT